MGVLRLCSECRSECCIGARINISLLTYLQPVPAWQSLQRLIDKRHVHGAVIGFDIVELQRRDVSVLAPTKTNTLKITPTRNSHIVTLTTRSFMYMFTYVKALLEEGIS